MPDQDYVEHERDDAYAATAEAVDENQLLRALIYQLNEVQKNLYGDVKKFSESSHDLLETHKGIKASFKSLSSSVKDLSSLALELRYQIQETIQSSIKETLKSHETALGKTLVAAAAEPTNKLVESLDNSVRHAERTLNTYIGETTWSRWIYLGAGALSGLFVVLFFMLFLKAKPFTFVSEDDMVTYRNGITIERAWPHLSEKEKQKIDDLAKPKAEKSTK